MWSMTSQPQSSSCSELGDNPAMDISEEQIDALEEALRRLGEVDPADLPEPAADLADLLSRILDEMENA